MYGHMTVSELTALRTRLQTALHDRLTAPTSASSAGRQVQYQQRVQDIRRELEAVNAEIARREGDVMRGPIYMAG